MGKATFGGNGQYELIDNEDGTFTIYDTVAGSGTTFTNGGLIHDDLTNLNSNDHHTKTSSSSELSDVSADSVSGAHHTEPTAGGFIVDEATNQFGLDAEQWTRDNPNGGTPITALESGESYELPVFVPDGKSIKLYEQNVVLVDDTATGGFTTDANLISEVVDPSGTKHISKSGLNASADGSTLYNDSNSSGGMKLYLVRIVNTDGSATFDSPGAIGSFSVVVE